MASLPRRPLAGLAKTKLCFRKGDILFQKIRPYFHKVGIALVDGLVSSEAIVTVPMAKEYMSAVWCCVSSDEFVRHGALTVLKLVEDAVAAFVTRRSLDQSIVAEDYVMPAGIWR